MFVWKDENVWKRGRGSPILRRKKKQSLSSKVWMCFSFQCIISLSSIHYKWLKQITCFKLSTNNNYYNSYSSRRMSNFYRNFWTGQLKDFQFSGKNVLRKEDERNSVEGLNLLKGNKNNFDCHEIGEMDETTQQQQRQQQQITTMRNYFWCDLI